MCIPVWKSGTAHICEQSLLFLLIGRDLLSSEEETKKKKNPNQPSLEQMEKAAELIDREMLWLIRWATAMLGCRN